jgi:hypothetical protein
VGQGHGPEEDRVPVFGPLGVEGGSGGGQFLFQAVEHHGHQDLHVHFKLELGPGNLAADLFQDAGALVDLTTGQKVLPRLIMEA